MNRRRYVKTMMLRILDGNGGRFGNSQREIYPTPKVPAENFPMAPMAL